MGVLEVVPPGGHARDLWVITDVRARIGASARTSSCTDGRPDPRTSSDVHAGCEAAGAALPTSAYKP